MFKTGIMVGFERVKSRLVLAECLIMAVSGAFLFNATDLVRSFEFEAAGTGTWSAAVTNIDCLAV
ncbi:MAG: hypothetical protein LBD86_06420 [Spirochaetaceae bacterium]|jgi:hypothetical protein|nr:hypothetical protein [Spirochaetaceae bacterium]